MWQITANHDSPLVMIDGGYWRAIQFIPNCYTVEAVETKEQAHQVASAFGLFTSALSDFPASKLDEIIPDFHNLDSPLNHPLIHILYNFVQYNYLNELDLECCLRFHNSLYQVLVNSYNC